MKKLKFYGASDDLFEMDGDLEGEIGCYDSGAVYHLKAKDGELLVFAQYAPEKIPGPTWVIGVTMIDEGKAIPPWTMHFENAPPSGFPDPRSYSPMLVIEAPDDVIVKEIGGDES